MTGQNVSVAGCVSKFVLIMSLSWMLNWRGWLILTAAWNAVPAKSTVRTMPSVCYPDSAVAQQELLKVILKENPALNANAVKL